MTKTDHEFMQRAIQIAEEGVANNQGGPFGAVVVKDGVIIGESCNLVTSTNDPTAHAEVSAIRKACKKLGSFQLDGCIIYTSCEPCPMCLGAIYWARPDKVYYGCNREDAAAIGFDDQFIYDELDKPINNRAIPLLPLLREQALVAFENWRSKDDKKEY
ncbi:MAG: nucleoside deaminase [Aureispira sp.]